MKDYYAILEVPPTASPEAIREQYLFLMQAWHPDKFAKASQKAKAEEKCKEINNAYAVLGDAVKRARYDRELGAPYPGPATRRQPAEPRPRKQSSQAAWQPAEEPPQPGQPVNEEQRRAEHERKAREAEEWIRVFFEQARRRQSTRPAPLARDPIRVLLVADLPEAHDRMRAALRGLPDVRVVGEVADAKEATRQFDDLAPDVTAVYAGQASMNAIGATEAIRRKHPIAKVIIIDAPGDTDHLRRAALAGACDYLIKPPAADDLAAAIRLAAERPVPAAKKAAP